MKPLRIATLVLMSVAAGLLLSLTAAAPARADDVTITSPSTIIDVGADRTPGATITGTAHYFEGSLDPFSTSEYPVTPNVSCVDKELKYYLELLDQQSYETAAVTVDGSCVDFGGVPEPLTMDSGETHGALRGSWTFFVPATAFPVPLTYYSRQNSVDRTHNFHVDILVITENLDGSVTNQILDSIEKPITLVPVLPEPSTTPTGAQTTPSPSSDTPSATPTPAAGEATQPPGSGHTASRLGTGTADADSVYSALTPVQNIHPTLTSAIILVAVTLVLLLLIGFPGVLVESTVSKHYDELFPWVKARQAKEADVNSPARVATWITVTLGVAIATIISGFVDPQFGLNPGSARVLLSSAIVFIALSVVGWLFVEWVIHSTDPNLKPSIEFKWFSLVVVALAVLLSRLTGFEPGIVFGLVAGLSFGAALSTIQSARTVLVSVAYAFIIGLGSWLAYSALKPPLEDHPSVVSQFTLDMLAGIAIAGMSTLPVALLPITGLGGEAVFKWNRWVWAVVYAAGLASFFLVLMPLPQSWGDVSLALIVWVILYGCFAVGAIMFWAYFRIKDGATDGEAVRHAR